MQKSYKNVFLYLIFAELLFVLFISFFYDKSVDLIFYVHTNLYFLIAVFSWFNYKNSVVNKWLIFVWAIEATVVTFGSLTALIWRIYLVDTYIQYLFVLFILVTLFDMFKTLYIFVNVVFKGRSNTYYIKLSVIILLVIAVLFYSKFLFKKIDFTEFNFSDFSENYIVYILNFCLLATFWIYYFYNKIIYSEYISNILAVHTIVVALEVLYSFSVQNDGYLHVLGQYFNAILNLILLLLWIQRIIYYSKPESIINERYVANYYLLQGIVERPQHGILYELYLRLNRSTIIVGLILIFGFSIYIFYFNNVVIFVKLNILILILASIISIILAVLTWYKRWYDSVGFFFRKRKK